jgi:hypothetical protein
MDNLFSLFLKQKTPLRSKPQHLESKGLLTISKCSVKYSPHLFEVLNFATKKALQHWRQHTIKTFFTSDVAPIEGLSKLKALPPAVFAKAPASL